MSEKLPHADTRPIELSVAEIDLITIGAKGRGLGNRLSLAGQSLRTLHLINAVSFTEYAIRDVYRYTGIVDDKPTYDLNPIMRAHGINTGEEDGVLANTLKAYEVEHALRSAQKILGVMLNGASVDDEKSREAIETVEKISAVYMKCAEDIRSELFPQ